VRNDLSGSDPTGTLVRSLRHSIQLFDAYICVSETARRSLISAIPESERRAQVIYNILGAEEMRERAKADPPPFLRSPVRVSILTVCRLRDHAKGLMRMVSVCQRLRNAGHAFIWYIIGDGQDREKLQAQIIMWKLQEVLVLLGELSNPFPAYLEADVIAMLSYYEGLSGMVNEARVMQKAVIATRVSGIDEQLINGENGLVVDNDEESIIKGMSLLLTDPALRKKLAQGGYPEYLLDDDLKIRKLEAVLLGSTFGA